MNPLVGGCKLYLTEISCGSKISMAIKVIRCTRHSFVLVTRLTMVGPREKMFKINVLRKLENAILRLVFANIVFHTKAILLPM